MADETATSADAEPLSPEAALCRLDDREFVELVAELRERRGWFVDRREGDAWYVDLLATTRWPARRRVLLRVHRPGSDKRLSTAEVRHFTGTVQHAEVDGGVLVTAADVPASVSHRAAELGVEVVDNEVLVERLERFGGTDLLDASVDRPVVAAEGPVARVPDRLVGLLDRLNAVERVERALRRRLSPEPTVEEFAELSFSGVRVALGVATGLFLLAVAVANEGLGFWLLLGLFFLVAYGGLLPAMAADISLLRRAEESPWTPTWWYLASFLLAPAMLVAGGHYWFRRRSLTPRERRGPD